MVMLWFVQRKTANAGIVDVGWSAGIGILGLLFALTSDGYAPRRLLVAAEAALAGQTEAHLARAVASRKARR